MGKSFTIEPFSFTRESDTSVLIEDDQGHSLLMKNMDLIADGDHEINNHNGIELHVLYEKLTEENISKIMRELDLKKGQRS